MLHTHADAVLALTNTPDGREHVREVYGDALVVVPYVMPGFVLAKLCAELFPAERHAGTVGMVLLNHGLFTFADDARTAYETHVELVARALDHVEPGGRRASASAAPAPGRHGAGRPGGGGRPAPGHLGRRRPADGPPVLQRRRRPAGSPPAPDLGAVAQVGPATPDHVLRTKRVPLLGRDVAAYVTGTTRPTSSGTGPGSATGR